MSRPLIPLPRKHGDGFMLMWYADKRGGRRERIWNSRDAITPFAIAARDGEREDLQHVDWQLDQFAPTHVPAIGDRVFVSLTPELARPLAREYVEKFWNHPEYPMGDRFGEQGQVKTVEMFVVEWCQAWGGESPHLITVDEAWRAIFIARAEAATERDDHERRERVKGMPNGGRWA